jgi:hypothetical protein
MKVWIPGIAMILHTESNCKKGIATITTCNKKEHTGMIILLMMTILFRLVRWYPHSQFTVETRTEVGFRNRQLNKNVGDGHRKHKHKSWLFPDQATRHYTNRLHIRCNAEKHFYKPCLKSVQTWSEARLHQKSIDQQFNCDDVTWTSHLWFNCNNVAQT